MKKIGFSLNEIEEFENKYYAKDYFQILKEVVNVRQQEEKEKRINKLLDVINMMDAMYYAIAAVMARKGKGYRAYVRKRRSVIRQINKLLGRKQNTIWERMKRKSNRI